MRKLTSFPMEKLCYDLKLEVLEQLEPNDAIELIKVNAGLRSILLRTPWIVFGHHVHSIYFRQGEIRIEKVSIESFVKLDADLHFPLIKRIHSCNDLTIFLSYKQFSDKHVAILNQLNSVKRLWLLVYQNESLLKFLENFRTMIEEFVYSHNYIDFFNGGSKISELFKNFIANQVNDCKEVWFRCRSAAAFHFYYDDFAKTSIKYLEIRNYSDHMGEIEEIVQLIVKKQIPSKNLKAAFHVATGFSQEMNARILDFLSQSPGMKRFDGENNEKVIKMANELFERRATSFSSLSFDFTGYLLFRRNIDSNRDCVYMLSSAYSAGWTHFFAFYVQTQSKMIEF